MHDRRDASMPFSRRLFIQQGLTLASLATTVPWFVQRSALSAMRPLGSPLGSQPGVPEERVLVIVQLGGGNDGLNTVVPYGNAAYQRARPSLAIREPGKADGALELDAARGIGLHPSLSGLRELHDRGQLAIVQGVGYPNPNRSHFASMDIWHTADASGRGAGWVGRYFDNTCNGTPDPQRGVAIGRETPLAMLGRSAQPVTFENEDAFRWSGSELHPALSQRYDRLQRTGPLGDLEPSSQAAFLMRTALDAQVSSDRIRAAVAKTPLAEYPGTPLARQLRIVASMIRDQLPTRVYYATLGGFDTHATQAGAHGRLMRQLGDALAAFQRDLDAQGQAGRVLTMVFSEFGRRVRQNASGGTDHGAAAPMLLLGPQVRPGLLGEHPSLEDLDNAGDLKFAVDFRSVYAGVLEDWLGAPSEPVLRARHRKAELLRPGFAAAATRGT